MKHFLTTLICLSIIHPCIAETQISTIYSGDGLIALRNEITRLENQLASKTETLNKCAEKNKNFQVAGVATIGLAGVGIATNVSLHSTIKEQKQQTENMKDKIKNADIESEKFTKEFEELEKNIDAEKFAQEIKTTLTEQEFARLQELYNNDFENIAESDKILFEKMLRAMRKCQK